MAYLWQKMNHKKDLFWFHRQIHQPAGTCEPLFPVEIGGNGAVAVLNIL